MVLNGLLIYPLKDLLLEVMVGLLVLEAIDEGGCDQPPLGNSPGVLHLSESIFSYFLNYCEQLFFGLLLQQLRIEGFLGSLGPGVDKLPLQDPALQGALIVPLLAWSAMFA